MVYNKYDLTFDELLKIDGSSTIHHQNIRSVAIEMYKVKNGLSPMFMSDIFQSNGNSNENVSYFTRNHNDFYNYSNPKTVNKGICSLQYFGPVVWNMIPTLIKNSENVSTFKENIRKWEIKNCCCRLCKNFVPGLGYTDIKA